MFSLPLPISIALRFTRFALFCSKNLLAPRKWKYRKTGSRFFPSFSSSSSLQETQANTQYAWSLTWRSSLKPFLFYSGKCKLNILPPKSIIIIFHKCFEISDMVVASSTCSLSSSSFVAVLLYVRCEQVNWWQCNFSSCHHLVDATTWINFYTLEFRLRNLFILPNLLELREHANGSFRFLFDFFFAFAMSFIYLYVCWFVRNYYIESAHFYFFFLSIFNAMFFMS